MAIFECPTCKKQFNGAEKLNRHHELFPEHFKLNKSVGES
jgi:hypothetical protein